MNREPALGTPSEQDSSRGVALPALPTRERRRRVLPAVGDLNAALVHADGHRSFAAGAA